MTVSKGIYGQQCWGRCSPNKTYWKEWLKRQVAEGNL